jgi:A/G-specific adenine glycosylase
LFCFPTKFLILDAIMTPKNFTQKIVEWYRDHKRLLPWRDTTDPYKIWLSEIILQQTRVAQGFPYYLKFVSRFPDIRMLARAGEREILRLWQGLGYYTRARNLRRCAILVVKEYDGQFPNNFNDLRKLPGIGNYTAAAIASLAFHEPVAVVDGNVYRVLARIFGITLDIAQPATHRFFFDKANGLISHANPGEFNQALMEFGALQCTPKNPLCETCIFNNACAAFESGRQAYLPVKRKKPKSRRRYLYYFVFRQHQTLALQQRMQQDIWQGLYDFQLVETRRATALETIVARNEILKKIRTTVDIGRPSKTYQHVLSHQTLFVKFIPVTLRSKPKGSAIFPPATLKLYSRREIHRLPKPVIVDRYLSDTGYL